MKPRQGAETVSATTIALTTAATSHDPAARLGALAGLVRAGAVPRAGQLSHLVVIAGDSDSRVRLLLQKYLRQLIEADRPSGRDFRPALERGLRDSDCSIRVAALEALGRTLPTAQTDMLPQITEAVADPEEIVRHQAAAVLLNLSGAAEPALDRIVTAVARSEPGEWDAALGVLLKLDPLGEMTGALLATRMPPDRLVRLKDHLSAIHADQFLAAIHTAAPTPDVLASPPPNGPRPPNEFWWNGEKATLERIPWLLLDLLWKDHRVTEQRAEEVCWTQSREGDAEDESGVMASSKAIKSAMTKLRKALRQVNAPHVARIKSGHLILDEKK